MKKRRAAKKKLRHAPKDEAPQRILKYPADPALAEQLRTRAERHAQGERKLTEARRVIDRALKERDPGYQTDRLLEALQLTGKGGAPKSKKRQPSKRKLWARGKIKELRKQGKTGGCQGNCWSCGRRSSARSLRRSARA